MSRLRKIYAGRYRPYWSQSIEDGLTCLQWNPIVRSHRKIGLFRARVTMKAWWRAFGLGSTGLMLLGALDTEAQSNGAARRHTGSTGVAKRRALPACYAGRPVEPRLWASVSSFLRVWPLTPLFYLGLLDRK